MKKNHLKKNNFVLSYIRLYEFVCNSNEEE